MILKCHLSVSDIWRLSVPAVMWLESTCHFSWGQSHGFCCHSRACQKYPQMKEMLNFSWRAVKEKEYFFFPFKSIDSLDSTPGPAVQQLWLQGPRNPSPASHPGSLVGGSQVTGHLFAFVFQSTGNGASSYDCDPWPEKKTVWAGCAVSCPPWPDQGEGKHGHAAERWKFSDTQTEMYTLVPNPIPCYCPHTQSDIPSGMVGMELLVPSMSRSSQCGVWRSPSHRATASPRGFRHCPVLLPLFRGLFFSCAT